MKVLAALCLLATALAAPHAATKGPPTTKAPLSHVVDEAKRAGAGRFFELVQSSEIKDILNSQGPLTLFAPTDAAIEAFDPVELVRITADPARLHAFLAYHAGFGQVASSDISNEQLVTSLGGFKLRLNVYSLPNGTVVTATGSPVSMVDLPATNGIVHLVDKVLYPPPSVSLMENLLSANGFGLLYGLIQRSPAVKALLETEGPFTLFAPTDRAIQKLSPDEVVIILENKEILENLLKFHTVSGTFYTPSMVNGQKLTSLNNGTLSITREDPFNSIVVNGIFVDETQITALTNGIMYGIDTILGSPEDLVHYLRRVQQEKN